MNLNLKLENFENVP
jgi:hypothetical protein